MCELLFGILCLCPSPHPTPNRRILKAHSNHCPCSRPFHLPLLLLLSTTHRQSMILLVNSLIKMTSFLLPYIHLKGLPTTLKGDKLALVQIFNSRKACSHLYGQALSETSIKSSNSFSLQICIPIGALCRATFQNHAFPRPPTDQ